MEKESESNFRGVRPVSNSVGPVRFARVEEDAREQEREELMRKMNGGGNMNNASGDVTLNMGSSYDAEASAGMSMRRSIDGGRFVRLGANIWEVYTNKKID